MGNGAVELAFADSWMWLIFIGIGLGMILLELIVSIETGLDLVYLLAPTSTDERIEIITSRSRGFVYLVSLTGVTGARNSLPQDLEDFVGRVRKKSKQPLCVGFGIASPEQAERVGKIADGVIVGSRIIQLIEQDSSLEALKTFIRSLREALN